MLVNYSNLKLLMFKYFFESNRAYRKYLSGSQIDLPEALSKILDIDSANVGGTKY